MISGFDVASKLQQYLAQQINVESFREWVVCAHIEIANEKDASRVDSEASRLLADIQGRYAEFSDGLVTEDALRRRIGALLAPRAQSAEAQLLNAFYSAPSFPSEPLVGTAESTNVSTVPNYQPEGAITA